MRCCAETYGIMVYQEDVSRIAMAMAGFSAADADLLRKILSKKRAGKKARGLQGNVLSGGGRARRCARGGGPGLGNDPEFFRLLVLQAAFGFVCAGLVQVRWLRAHYPAEFMAAVLTNQGGYYSPFAYVSEARRMGLKVLLPDVNESRKEYWGKERTHPGRTDAAEGIAGGGPGSASGGAQEAAVSSRLRISWRGLDIDPSDVKILIKAGAMDSIAQGPTRPEMIWKTLAWHEARAARRAVALSLFQDMPAVAAPRVPEYSARTVLEHELETLDFLISRHPLDAIPRAARAAAARARRGLCTSMWAGA